MNIYETGLRPTIEPEIQSEIEPAIEPKPTHSTHPMIQRAQKSTQKARDEIVQGCPRKHDIQHFKIGDIVSLKVLRDDRTPADNRRLYRRILEEPSDLFRDNQAFTFQLRNWAQLIKLFKLYSFLVGALF